MPTTARTPVERFINIIWKDTDIDAAGTPDIFDGPCTVYSFRFVNPASGSSGTDNFVKVYDATSATYATRPLIAFKVPAGADPTISCGDGLKFSTGLTIRATQGVMNHASSDGTNPGANLAVYVVAKGD